MSTDTERRAAARAEIDRATHEALDATRRRTRKALLRLLGHVRAASDLLRPAGGGGRIEARPHRRIVAGLVALVERREWWLRPVEEWRPPGGNPLPQFADLARHLLARYPVPAFMTSAWLEGPTWAARRRPGWYRHLGLGRSIRTADIPIRYTRRMAHEFALAPAHLTVEHALRRGQVRGLGGSEELADSVLASRLGHDFENDDFWRTVVQFLVNHPRLDPVHVGPIVEYLHDRKFAPQEVFVEDGVLDHLPPPRPGLSMKGRTVASLLREVAAWRERLGREARRPALRWAACGIGGLRLVEGDARRRDMRVWTVRGLTDSGELVREGRAMRHCVASYARSCSRGATTIWSLRVEDARGGHRVLTIEVDPAARAIRQASRCCNAAPHPKDRAVMELWARRVGLTVEC